MASIPDQFLFVNKTITSASLSHSNAKERFDIHSHVHSKFHKDKRQPKRPAFRAPNASASASDESASASATTRGITLAKAGRSSASGIRVSQGANERAQYGLVDLAISKKHAQLNGDAIDPFFCSSTPIDAKDQNLLHYPFQSFIETTFDAESLLSFSSATNFRHRKAITQRLQQCVVDDLIMYTTLAYCASCMRWTIGEDGGERPTELYILKAIAALRSRLESSELVDPWLILSIYALAVSEMWAQGYEAATAHLKMIRHLVVQLGGLSSLDPYLMESILLCDKYVAIGKFEPPILPLDWEPGPLPTKTMAKIKSWVKPALGHMAQGFPDHRDFLGIDLLLIFEDIVTCIQVAEFMQTEPIPNAGYRRWLFLRHQALISRLLSLQSQTQIRECTRVALIVWLLKVTAYFGAQRWSKRLLPKLKLALLRLEDNGEWSSSPLLLWMTCLGAMTAEYTDERDWFLGRTVKLSRSLGIMVEKGSFRQILQRYLFLESEDGLQFFRMIRAARQMESHAEKDY